MIENESQFFGGVIYARFGVGVAVEAESFAEVAGCQPLVYAFEEERHSEKPGLCFHYGEIIEDEIFKPFFPYSIFRPFDKAAVNFRHYRASCQRVIVVAVHIAQRYYLRVAEISVSRSVLDSLTEHTVVVAHIYNLVEVGGSVVAESVWCRIAVVNIAGPQAYAAETKLGAVVAIPPAKQLAYEYKLGIALYKYGNLLTHCRRSVPPMHGSDGRK